MLRAPAIARLGVLHGLDRDDPTVVAPPLPHLPEVLVGGDAGTRQGGP